MNRIARVDPKDIVAYAHLIAGTTSAPAQWKPGVFVDCICD